MPAGKRGRLEERGYTLIELLVVVAIFGSILLVALPNLRGGYERHVLRSNSRGVAATLNVGRMRAVATNVTHTVELDAAMAHYCAGRGPATATHSIVVYRSDPSIAIADRRPEDCFSFAQRVDVETVPDASAKTVVFQATGMARDVAPNWFLVWSRSHRLCQLVCVNAAGIVRTNPVGSACSSPDYGADSTTPCPPPS